MEYEETAKNLDKTFYPKDWKKAEPAMYRFPERQNVGSLQRLKFKDAKKTQSVDGSSLYSALNSKRIAVK